MTISIKQSAEEYAENFDMSEVPSYCLSNRAGQKIQWRRGCPVEPDEDEYLLYWALILGCAYFANIGLQYFQQERRCWPAEAFLLALTFVLSFYFYA